MAALAMIAVVLCACGMARAFTAEQVDKGRDVFRLQCARCHGPDGQGITNIYRGMTAPPMATAATIARGLVSRGR